MFKLERSQKFFVICLDDQCYHIRIIFHLSSNKLFSKLLFCRTYVGPISKHQIPFTLHFCTNLSRRYFFVLSNFLEDFFVEHTYIGSVFEHFTSPSMFDLCLFQDFPSNWKDKTTRKQSSEIATNHNY